MLQGPCKTCIVRPTCMSNCKKFEKYVLYGYKKISILITLSNLFILTLCSILSLILKSKFNIENNIVKIVILSIISHLPFFISLIVSNYIYHKSHKKDMDIYFYREKVRIENGHWLP